MSKRNLHHRPTSSLVLLPLAIALSLSLFSSRVMAQGSSLFGSGGSTGGNGNTGTATTSAARSATGAIGGASGGASGGAAGGAGQLQLPDFAQFGGAAQAPTGFIGRGNATQFTWNRAAGQQTINAGGTTRFSGGGTGSTQSGEVESRAKLIRVQQRLAFRTQTVISSNVRLNLETQFEALVDRFPEIGIEVDPQGQTILSGIVESDDDRKLAEVIARLEPGVRTVINQLETAPSSDDSSTNR